jgi:hypothetical protein
MKYSRGGSGLLSLINNEWKRDLMRQKNRPLIKEEKSAHPITIIDGVQIT